MPEVTDQTADMCAGREAKYVPWSFGEIYECLTCGLRLRQDHNLRPSRGKNYDAVYPMREHETRPRQLCSPCGSGFHDVCSKRRGYVLVCDCVACWPVAARALDGDAVAPPRIVSTRPL